MMKKEKRKEYNIELIDTGEGIPMCGLSTIDVKTYSLEKTFCFKN